MQRRRFLARIEEPEKNWKFEAGDVAGYTIVCVASGIALGFDRLCAILGGSESIRDFIAFPKNNAGRDVMLDAPSEIAAKQFEELQIKLDLR